MPNTFSYTAILNQLLAQKTLSFEQAYQTFHALLHGHLTPAQVAGLLVSLRVRGETVDEVTAAAQVMRELVTPVPNLDDLNLVDLCGTGGDGAHTFNISTACMFVLAAAGAKVAKHGGRSVSSSSGSADVLEALGVNINLNPEQVAHCVRHLGLGFMFAPNHHSAMRFAAPVRKELGVRTLFNILGPLTNPAHAKYQVMGVYSEHLLGLQAEVLHRLGSVRALIVHGQNGMDELCLECDTHIAELNNGHIQRYTVSPKQLGLASATHAALQAHTVEESKTKLIQALEGQGGAMTDIVVLNSAAGLYVAAQVDTLAQGIELARTTIASGAAIQKLHQFIQYTQQVSST